MINTDLARILEMSVAGVGFAVEKDEKLAMENKLDLLGSNYKDIKDPFLVITAFAEKDLLAAVQWILGRDRQSE